MTVAAEHMLFEEKKIFHCISEPGLASRLAATAGAARPGRRDDVHERGEPSADDATAAAAVQAGTEQAQAAEHRPGHEAFSSAACCLPGAESRPVPVRREPPGQQRTLDAGHELCDPAGLRRFFRADGVEGQASTRRHEVHRQATGAQSHSEEQGA